MRSPTLSVSLLALFVLPVGSFAQTTPAPAPDLAARLATLEKAIEAKRDTLKVPGAALVIVQNDRIIYLKGLGYRDMEAKQPVTPDTLFAIGSSTKAFTALTVMLSAEEGKLKTSDPPRKYLSYFSLRDPEADAKMTVGDLLCHKCGLERTDLAWYTGKLSPKEIIQVAGQCKPTAKYGEKFQYQNVMFLAAGEVVARVQHQSWTDFVTKRVLNPLGMKASTLSVPRMISSPDHAVGYQTIGESKTARAMPYRDLACIAPAGAINSSARDMAQWVRFLLNDGVVNGRRLVSEASLHEMMTPKMKISDKTQYGYGWFLRDWHGHPVVEHGGNIDGFSAEVALMPDQHLGFVLLCNQNVSGLPPSALNIVWDNLVPLPKTEESPADAATPAVKPEAEAGTYAFQDKVTIAVTLDSGKLIAAVQGQPPYPLTNVGGRKYKLDTPAPDGFFITFRPNEKDPKVAEMFLQQPQGNLVLTKKSDAGETPYAAPLSVDDLQKKVIDALGGEAALRRHSALVVQATLLMDTQGVTGTLTLSAKAPAASTETMELYALKKRILTSRDWCDGKAAASDSSLSATFAQTGKGLANAILAADFYEPLHWKTLYKTVVITKQTPVDGEDCYVVEKTLPVGDPITDYVSTKTFLLRKRDYKQTDAESGAATPATETYSDYRSVDGVQFAFRRLRQAAGGNDTLLTVQRVQWNARVADRVFRAKG